MRPKDYVNKVTNIDCPACDAKLTLRKNRQNGNLFLGCSTYQTTGCPGSLPLDDDRLIEIRKHFTSLNGPRQLGLLEKGPKKVKLNLSCEIYAESDDTPEQIGLAQLSFDNVSSDLRLMGGSEVFATLIEQALESIAI